MPAIETVRREVAQFVEVFKFPCVLSQPLADGSFILIDKFSNPQQMEVSLPIGHRYPRDACAQMRAYLGWASTQEIDEWMKDWKPVRYTNKTPMTAKSVRSAIAETRQRGYALSCGEFTEGLMALALPIYDRNGSVQYIFNCSAPMESIQDIEREVAARMRETVAKIHRGILAKTPADF
jgi:DNA-binding IclR family transcriptional regulator